MPFLPQQVLPWLAAGMAVLLAAVPVGARTLEVGPGKPYAQPSEAAAVAQDGDRVVIAAGEYADCAVWRQNDLTVEGVSQTGTVIADKACQGKALFVIPGNNVTIRNLTLTRARVPNANESMQNRGGLVSIATPGCGSSIASLTRRTAFGPSSPRPRARDVPERGPAPHDFACSL